MNSLSPFYSIRYSTSVIQLHKSLKISHHYIYQAYNFAIFYDRQTAGKAYNQNHQQLAALGFPVYAYKREKNAKPHIHPLLSPASLQ